MASTRSVRPGDAGGMGPSVEDAADSGRQQSRTRHGRQAENAVRLVLVPDLDPITPPVAAEAGAATAAATTRRGTLLVLAAAVGWSLAGLFTRSVDTSSWAIIGWRGVFSAVAVTGWLCLARRPTDTAGARRWHVGTGGLLLATLSTVATALYIPALQATSVTNVVVVYATAPFVTAGLAWLVLRERATRTTLIASTGAVVGVLVTAVGGRAGHSAQDVRGLLLAAGMTLALAGVAVCGRRLRDVSQVPATAVSAVQLAVLGLALAPDRWLGWRDLAILGLFGVVQAASLASYIEGARLLPASRTAVLSTADVPLAPVWVWIAFGDIPVAASVVGGLIVLAAVLWDARRGRSTCM